MCSSSCVYLCAAARACVCVQFIDRDRDTQTGSTGALGEGRWKRWRKGVQEKMRGRENKGVCAGQRRYKLHWARTCAHEDTLDSNNGIVHM